MINGTLAIADGVGSWDWNDLDAHHYDGAAVYISSSNPRKMASKQNIALGVSTGKILLPVFENTGHASSGGSALGVQQAQECIAIMEQLGIPKNTPFANAESDYDADPRAVGPYYSGFHTRSAELGWHQIIGYAGGAVDRMLKALGLIYGEWFTCSGGFQGSNDSTGRDIWQRCANESGIVPIPSKAVDTNYILNPHLGLWGMAGFNPNPTPLGWVTVTEGMRDGVGPLADEAHRAEVHETQLRLKRYSLDHNDKPADPGVWDGIHGPTTQSAIHHFKIRVQEFQRAFHLAVWPDAPSLAVWRQIDAATINALRFFTTPASH